MFPLLALLEGTNHGVNGGYPNVDGIGSSRCVETETRGGDGRASVLLGSRAVRTESLLLSVNRMQSMDLLGHARRQPRRLAR